MNEYPPWPGPRAQVHSTHARPGRTPPPENTLTKACGCTLTCTGTGRAHTHTHTCAGRHAQALHQTVRPPCSQPDGLAWPLQAKPPHANHPHQRPPPANAHTAHTQHWQSGQCSTAWRWATAQQYTSRIRSRMTVPCGHRCRTHIMTLCNACKRCHERPARVKLCIVQWNSEAGGEVAREARAGTPPACSTYCSAHPRRGHGVRPGRT